MNFLNLLRSGLDTHDIAKRTKLDEATIYNRIHHQREVERNNRTSVPKSGGIKYAGSER